MYTYFWYAKLDDTAKKPYYSFSGLVKAETPLKAFEQAKLDAKSLLSGVSNFTIQQFNKVS